MRVEMTFKEMVDLLSKKGHHVSADLIYKQNGIPPIRVGGEIILVSTDTPNAVAKILVTGFMQNKFRFSVLGLVTSAGKTTEELVDFIEKVSKKSLKDVQV